MPTDFELSIIIVTYNSAPYLGPCLKSISKLKDEVRCEVCVVDNASQDRTLQILKGDFPWVKIIPNDRNLGFATAVNQGLQVTSAPIVLWLNPDSFVHE